MTINGPTEEDSNYIADTGASPADMQAQVDAYRATITQFNNAVWQNKGFTCVGGCGRSAGAGRAGIFYFTRRFSIPLPLHFSSRRSWMMMDWGGSKLNTGINNTTDPASCKAILAQSCVPTPSRWNRFQGYAIPGGGFKMTNQSFTDYTAEFLLTRGPYALLGYTWLCVQALNP